MTKMGHIKGGGWGGVHVFPSIGKELCIYSIPLINYQHTNKLSE